MLNLINRKIRLIAISSIRKLIRLFVSEDQEILNNEIDGNVNLLNLLKMITVVIAGINRIKLTAPSWLKACW